MKLLIGGLDIETTGLKQAEGHRIIEFAISVFAYETDTGDVAGKLQYAQRINPCRSIDPGAQAVHGISFEALAAEPVWEAVAPKVEKLIAACDLVVAHNGHGFDFPFIDGEMERIGKRLEPYRSFDTMLEGRWATPLGKNPNLGELCFACDVTYDKSKAHAALYDVDVMMQCFFTALRGGFYKIPYTGVI